MSREILAFSPDYLPPTRKRQANSPLRRAVEFAAGRPFP
jgi:hypothetical protein